MEKELKEYEDLVFFIKVDILIIRKIFYFYMVIEEGKIYE